METSGVSIKEYAILRARTLALRISIAGFILASAVVIGGSLATYYLRLDYAAKAFESSLSSSLIYGDLFQLTRTMVSLGKSDGVISSSIYSPSGKKLAGSDSDDLSSHLDMSFGFTLDGTLLNPHLKLRKPISYGPDSSATLEIVSRLPIEFLFSLLVFIGLLFLIASYFIIDASKKTALAIASPASLLASQVKQMGSQMAWGTIRDSDLKFREIVEVQKQFSDLFQRFSEAKEQEKRAQQEALIGRIASKVKHDVKQALFASDAVLRKLSGSPGHLEIMEASLKRIEATVDEIPRISFDTTRPTRVLAGGLEADSEKTKTNEIQLVGLIEPACNEFRAILSASSKQISLRFDYTVESLNLKVAVNQLHFRRMFANILANSLDAIVRSGQIEVCLQKTGTGEVLIEISDTGKGIPLEALELVGTHGYSYGKANGNGLGLSTAIEYVKSWNGTLSVSSEIGIGTTIRIALPLIKSSSEDLHRNISLVKNATL